MLQVYDRVLASKSVPTLVVLFCLVAGLYLFLGLFSFVRTRALSRAGYRLDVDLMELVKKGWINSESMSGNSKSRPLNDLGAIRQFLCSNGLPALCDLPWVPVYLAIVYLLHFWLGLLATGGAIIVISATVINEWITRKPISEATGWEVQDAQFAEMSNRNSDAILAMGMMSRVTQNWKDIRHNALANSQLAGGRSEFITDFTKATRMLVQSGILALGAYLAIYQEISPGAMIAASILSGRALAPVDLAVGNWKNFIKARQAYTRLSTMLSNSALTKSSPTKLPAPKAYVSVSDLLKVVKTSDGGATNARPILQGLNFKLEPGDGLGVVGPSASGKSSLAKLLVGLWMPDKGSVRLDGATFDQWERDDVGQYIGYLPQTIELLSGTVRQNIARFDDDVSDEKVVEAAKLAGVHQLILDLSNGYETDLSAGMRVLSGGQVQRIALARAVLRKPALVVLDEPNANLDAEGDTALTKAIEGLRMHGSCVVVMAHRPSAIAAVNKVLVLKDGHQLDFGPKEEILQRANRSGPNLKVAK